MAERPRSTSFGASPVERASAPAWFDDEAPLGRSALAALRRLGQRASASWPIWMAVALVASAALTFRQARKPPSAEVTIVLRVTEGTSVSTGAELGPGALHSYIHDLALTSDHLIGLMQRHPNIFPDLAQDPNGAVKSLLERTKISISDDDFIEERSPDDPPRSGRIALSFRGSDADLTATVTHDLADLLIRSTLAEQRATLEAREAAAGAAVSRAESEIAELSRADRTGTDPRLVAARDRWRAADQDQAAARLSLRAAAERQTLRFEVIDPGHVTAPVATTASLATGFLLTLLAALMGAAVLAGAFDPRVIDAADLASLGVVFLGGLPALPVARGHQSRDGEGKRQSRV